MRVNPTYKSLLEKSANALISAIEIYNKPAFSYREETFAILATNAIELLLKAQILKANSYNIKCLYSMEPALTKNGDPHKTRKKPKCNRSGNPLTIGLTATFKKLEELGFALTPNHVSSIEVLVELRDNAIHFYNDAFVAIQMQEIGFATVKNYFNLIKKWGLEGEFQPYNLHLMPLAYVNSKVVADSVLTDEAKNYLSFLKSKLATEDSKDQDFDIAITIDVKFSKTKTTNGLGIQYEAGGVAIALTEEDIRSKFPLTYKMVIEKAQKRYADFKQGKTFYAFMRTIKANEKLHYERLLDTESPTTSQKKPLFSEAIWKEFDKHYTPVKSSSYLSSGMATPKLVNGTPVPQTKGLPLKETVVIPIIKIP